MSSRCEQHLETIPGFRSRDVFASNMSDMNTHVNAVAQRTLSRPAFLGIDWGIECAIFRYGGSKWGDFVEERGRGRSLSVFPTVGFRTDGAGTPECLRTSMPAIAATRRHLGMAHDADSIKLSRGWMDQATLAGSRTRHVSHDRLRTDQALQGVGPPTVARLSR